MNTAKKLSPKELDRGSKVRKVDPTEKVSPDGLRLILFPHLSLVVRKAVYEAVHDARKRLQDLIYNEEGQGIALPEVNDDPIIIPRDIADPLIWDVQAKLDLQGRNVKIEKTDDAIRILMGDEK